MVQNIDYKYISYMHFFTKNEELPSEIENVLGLQDFEEFFTSKSIQPVNSRFYRFDQRQCVRDRNENNGSNGSNYGYGGYDSNQHRGNRNHQDYQDYQDYHQRGQQRGYRRSNTNGDRYNRNQKPYVGKAIPYQSS